MFQVQFVQSELEDGVEMSAEQQQLMRELSWLELEVLSIDFTAGSGWTVSPATISRRILVCMQIVIPTEQIQIAQDSLIKEGDVEPQGTLRINILLDDDLEPMKKDIVISAK